MKIQLSIDQFKKGNLNIPIHLTRDSIGVDYAESVEKQLTTNITNQSIPTKIDGEKTRFTPTPQIDTIKYVLWRNSTTPYYYADLGFTNDDILFRRNRFKKSFLKLNFYDSNDAATQQLLFQNILDTQIFSEQLDVNNELLDVSVMPVSFLVTNPQLQRGFFETYYSFWYKNYPSFAYPLDMFMYASFNNANNGRVAQFVASTASLNIQNFQQYNYIPYRFTNINNVCTYHPINTNRTIVMTSNNWVFNLYEQIL